MTTQAPKFNQTNVYRVRRNSRLNEGLFLCKVIMKKHGSVQIEGMGQTISLVAKFAQILNKNELGDVQSIRSDNVSSQERKGINPKLVVTLKKSAKFDKLTENITVKQ